MRNVLLLFLVRARDHVINTFYEDISLRSHKSRKQFDEVSHRLMYSAAKDTRMEIPAWSRHGDFVVRKTTQAVCQSRCASVEPVIIRLLFH